MFTRRNVVLLYGNLNNLLSISTLYSFNNALYVYIEWKKIEAGEIETYGQPNSSDTFEVTLGLKIKIKY